MRALTYNVAGCRDGIEPIRAAIAAADASIVCLQELRRGQTRTLARALGMHAVESASIAGPRYRNAVLTKERPESSRRVRLSKERSTVRANATHVVGSFHLGLDPEERVIHARRIAALFEDAATAVVCGDVNEPQHGAAFSVLLSSFDDGCATPSFPRAQPLHAIDVIFVRGMLITGCAALDVGGSDHRPVVATLQFH